MANTPGNLNSLLGNGLLVGASQSPGNPGNVDQSGQSQTDLELRKKMLNDALRSGSVGQGLGVVPGLMLPALGVGG